MACSDRAVGAVSAFEFWELCGKIRVDGDDVVDHSAVPDYERAVTYDLGKHHFWSGSKGEPGDLRGREQICGCDSCMGPSVYQAGIELNRYSCQCSSDTGDIVKYYTQPALKDAGRDQARAELLLQLAKQHCMHAEQGQPLLWPDRAADDPSRPYAYWLCVVRTDRAPGAGGAAQRAGAGAPDPPEEDLPAHMYWRWCSGKGQWLPCVHVRWFRSQVRGGLVFNKQANGGVAWCHEIPPVVLAGW